MAAAQILTEAAQQNEEAPQAEAKNADPKDDVVDAEFEEVKDNDKK